LLARRVIDIQPVPPLAKPEWIRVRLSIGSRFREVKRLLREHRLHTVCEEASCGVRIDRYAKVGVRKYAAAMPLTTYLSNSARVERGYSSIMISDSA
jgi:lipoate synthase